MVYEDFKYLPRGAASDKIWHVKHSILLKIRNMIDIKEVFLQWFINILIRNLLGLIIHVVLLKVKLCQATN